MTKEKTIQLSQKCGEITNMSKRSARQAFDNTHNNDEEKQNDDSIGQSKKSFIHS